MTDTTRESAERYRPVVSGSGEAGMAPCQTGFWVTLDDYAALLTRAEAAEAERDALAAKLALAVEAIPNGFGASYWRDDGVWAIYSMPGSKDTGIRAKDEKQRDDLLAHLGSTFRAALTQLTADTIPDPRAEGWNAAIEAAAEIYGKPFHSGGVAKSMAHFVRVDDHRKYQEACTAYRDAIRTIPCPYTPKEGKDDDQ